MRKHTTVRPFRAFSVLVTLLALFGVTLAGATMTSASGVESTPLQVDAGNQNAQVTPTAVHEGAAMAQARRMRFGAISLNIYTGRYGWANDFLKRKKARNAAQRKCRQGSYPGYCRKVVWVRNGCASVAVRWNANGSVNRYAWSSAFRTKAAAAKAARKKCGPKCRTRVTICTTRYY